MATTDTAVSRLFIAGNSLVEELRCCASSREPAVKGIDGGIHAPFTR
jgi:hypothetical protein